MMTFVAVLHLVVAFILIGLVLIQDSKGGGALGIGGGGSNSLLGATGAQTLWAKLTRVVALVFAITCISLTYLTAQKTRSVIESAPIPEVSSPIPQTSEPTATPAATPSASPAAPSEEKK